MTYENADIDPDSKDEWLDRTLEYGTEYWGDDITNRDTTGLHQFYDPFAQSLADLEEELKQVLDALRIQEATGYSLDLLGQRLGVVRISSSPAQGEITFISDSAVSKDYLIQSGTTVQTDAEDEIRFETTETTILSSGTTTTTAPIKAVENGSRGNVAAGTITDAPIYPAGVDEVNNSQATSFGRNKEGDEEYRERIQKSVAEIETTSGYHLFNNLKTKAFVKNIRFLDNSSDEIVDSIDPHQFEVVVDAEPGHKDEIAQVIFENMPMGADIVAGIHGTEVTGTASLPNNQTFTIPYSEPTKIPIYVDIEVESNGKITKSEIRDNIVTYIGGVRPSGNQVYGDLSVGDDVVYGEVEYQIRDSDGVYDISMLEVNTNNTTGNTSNISIGVNERAAVDASNITIQIL